VTMVRILCRLAALAAVSSSGPMWAAEASITLSPYGSIQKLDPLGVDGFETGAAVPFDYPGTRMAIAAAGATFGSGEPQQGQSLLQQIDNLAQAWLEARTNLSFGDTMAIGRLNEASRRLAEFEQQHTVREILVRMEKETPESCLALMIRLDWIKQDAQAHPGENFLGLVSRVVEQLAAANNQRVAALRERIDQLSRAGVGPIDGRWMNLYIDACDHRRALRIGPWLHKFPRIVFTRHHDIGGQHYAYTEDVSDSPYVDNNPFPPSGQLCLLEMDGLYGRQRVLIDEPAGLIRDPDVSYDGQRILFARRKSMTEDDYHLYEMTVDDGTVRQLTSGRGVADYEGAYLPGGQIVFNSTRCQQIVDCWWADVSNLYTCDADGHFLRRLGFDQVHSNYPQVMPDGRVIYTRWDYNDRGQLFPQPLFQMNPDGTGQTEFYGNNSWFPTTILHARGIPGTQRIVCVLSGHHTYQKGKLAIIDRVKGRRENAGVQLIAPIRLTEALQIDQYGFQGEQFQYPYPLDATNFLVAYSPEGSLQGRAATKKPFGIYFIDIDGRRELLAATPSISSSQAVPLMPRPEPVRRPSRVDYRDPTGRYFVQDVYSGTGLAEIPRGTIKKLRVVALEFRAAGIGQGSNQGPAGGALVSTPISINGAWDVKRVLGTATVHEDGSAAFVVPARTPVYFQALDENNHALQSMRSWSTLQPGETFSCVGCHENKNSAPSTTGKMTMAMRAGPQSLQPSHGSTQGFSFPKLVQPILDRVCVDCHSRKKMSAGESSISLEGTAALDQASLKYWSDAYKTLADPEYTSWLSPQSAPPMLRPYTAGAAKSRLIEILAAGHERVALSDEEMDIIACWIDLGVPFSGDYTEAMAEQYVPEYERWLKKRKLWADDECNNIRALIEAQTKQ
jgi:hydrazine synthase alpha subunit-like protein